MKKSISYVPVLAVSVVGLFYSQVIDAEPMILDKSIELENYQSEFDKIGSTRKVNVINEGVNFKIDKLAKKEDKVISNESYIKDQIKLDASRYTADKTESKEKLNIIDEDVGSKIDEFDQKEEEGSNESGIKWQKEVSAKIEESSSNDPVLMQRATDLNKLAENRIIIEQHCLDELEVDPCSRTPFEINVFGRENLKHISVATLNAALNPPADNNFIMGKNPIFDSVRENETIQKEVQQLITFLTNMSSEDADVEKAIEQTDHLLETLNSTIGIDNPFGLFIATINGGFKVLYSRILATQYLEHHEGNIAKDLTDFTKSASASLGAGGSFAGAKVSASLSASASEGATHHSLTATAKGGGGALKLGYGPFALTLGASFTKMLLIGSVLQRIEYGNGLTLSLEGKEMKKLQDAVKESERLYYSFFNAGMVLSKILKVIPQYADFRFGSFTDTNKPSRIHVINKELGGSASVLSNLGVSIKAIHSKMNVFNDNNDLLSLVDGSCSSLSGDLSEIIDKKLDRTQLFFDNKDKPIKERTRRGYVQILSEGNDDEVPSEKSVEMSLSIILGDLSYYIQILQSLAFFNNCSSVFDIDKTAKDNIKYLEDQKHKFEERWKVSGREQVFESILLTTANIRKLQSNESSIELGKKIHSQLTHLQELLRLSKNKSTRDSKGSYSKKSELIVKKIQLGTSIPGGASFSITAQKGLQPFITVSLAVPEALAGVILKRLPEIINALRNTKDTKNSMLNENKIYIAEAGQLCVDLLKLDLPKSSPIDLLKSNLQKISPVDLLKSNLLEISPISTISTFNINFVPGINGKPVISHYQTTVTSGVNLSASVNIGVSANASASANVGTTRFWPGTNTWWYAATKMGALGWDSKASEAIYNYQILPFLSGYAKNLTNVDSNLHKETEKKISELKEKAKGSSGDARKIDKVYNDLLSSAKTPNDEKFNSSVKRYLELQCKR